MKMSKNPLLLEADLPRFDQIAAKDFVAAIKTVTKDGQSKIKRLLAQKYYSWDNFIMPLELIGNRIAKVWSVISHLNSVQGTKEVRDAYQKALPIITSYTTELAQDSKIYKAFKQISSDVSYQKLDSVQKKIITDQLRDFVLSGVALKSQDKKKFKELSRKLAQLGHKFSCNVLDATQGSEIRLNKKETAGLPTHILELGKNNAAKKNFSGWLFTLDYPSYHALITYSELRAIRKKAFIAYVTRASEMDKKRKQLDNTKIITEILQIKQQLARLVSFENYAEYSLASKMAKEPKRVLGFLTDLADYARSVAIRELKELKQFAKQDGVSDFKPWDLAYYEEKLFQKRFGISQDKLRPYFPIDQVLTGMFAIVQKLYGIKVSEKKHVVAWDKQVRFFEVYAGTKLLGQFYLDLYCRENKRSGAWMGDYCGRQKFKDGSVQIPVAFLVGNFFPPLDGKSTLITHNDLLTLLHEFGHALQHLLTKVDYLSAAGINNIPWDAVELASQFMENWGWQSKGVAMLSRHYQTGKVLPRKLLDNLITSRIFNGAIHMLRQVEFSLIDFELHLEKKTVNLAKMNQLVKKVQKISRVTPVYPGARILPTFSHIFAGGYAAGYYSYKWAEVLSADAFSRFKKEGIFSRKAGQDFLRYILATGGSEDPMVLFKKFMGREPKIEALLKQEGIVR